MNETFIFDKYDTIFNFVLQFYNTFELLMAPFYVDTV